MKILIVAIALLIAVGVASGIGLLVIVLDAREKLRQDEAEKAGNRRPSARSLQDKLKIS